MNKYKFLFASLLCTILTASLAQAQFHSRIDSLEYSLKTLDDNDVKRLEILLELTREYPFVSPDTGIIYGNYAIGLSRETGDGIALAKALRYLGINYHYLNDYGTALAYYDSSLNHSVEIGYKDGEGASMFNVGSVYEHLGDYDRALEYYLIAIKIIEESGDRNAEAYILNGIANIHKLQKNYKLALKYFDKALAINIELEKQNEIAYCLYGIAHTHFLMDEPEKALEIHLRSLEIRQAINDRNGVSVTLGAIGQVYFSNKQFIEAEKYYSDALRVAEEIGNSWNVVTSSLYLGIILTEKQRFDAAITRLEYALDLALQTGSLDLLQRCYEVLAGYYAEVQDYQQSLAYYKLHSAMKDSMYFAESSQQIADMQTKYDTEKKDNEIRLQRAEIQWKEAEILKRNFQRNALLAGLLLIIVVATILYRSFRQNQKANLLLTQQNSEISQQKEEIETQRDHLETLNHQLQLQKDKLQEALSDLKQAQSQLVESERMASLGQLTGGIAHELNNPVNFISGTVNPLKRDIEDILRLQQEYDNILEKAELGQHKTEIEKLKQEIDLPYLREEIPKLLEGIGAGAQRSGQIVKGLRYFSRLDNEEFVRADIHEGLEATLTLLESKTKGKIEIQKNFTQIPEIECLPSKVNMVFLNVLTNSIQAIQEKGEIIIETSSSGGMVTVTIRDTGLGIEEELLPHIFEPFYTTREVGEGTGLGLSISYGIIEQHKGKIDVQSEPGKGTEISIILPVKVPL